LQEAKISRRPAEPHRLRDLAAAVRRRRAERGADRVCRRRRGRALDLDLVEAGEAGLQRAQRLLQASWKVRPIAITSPTDFIEVVSVGRRRGISRTRSAGILVTT
jgi:hypothetical protein